MSTAAILRFQHVAADVQVKLPQQTAENQIKNTDIRSKKIENNQSFE